MTQNGKTVPKPFPARARRVQCSVDDKRYVDGTFCAMGDSHGALRGPCQAVLGRFANAKPHSRLIRTKTRGLPISWAVWFKWQVQGHFPMVPTLTLNGFRAPLDPGSDPQPPLWPQVGMSCAWVPGRMVGLGGQKMTVGFSYFLLQFQKGQKY